MKRQPIKLNTLLFSLSIILTIALCPLRGLAVDVKELQSALLEQLEHRPAALLKIEGHRMDTASIDRALAKIYHESGLQPLWVSGCGPGERVKSRKNLYPKKLNLECSVRKRIHGGCHE